MAAKKPTKAKTTKEQKPQTQVEPETGGEMGNTLTMDDLITAAEDISECLELEPPIDTELEEEDLQAALVSAAKLLVTEDITMARAFPKGTPLRKRVGKAGQGPFLAIETLEVLEALGVVLPEAVEEAPKKSGPKKAPPKPRERKDVFSNPGACTFILMTTARNPDITIAEMRAALEEAGLSASNNTISIQMSDTKKTIAFLKSIGWGPAESE